jgi:hypothetical protein
MQLKPRFDLLRNFREDRAPKAQLPPPAKRATALVWGGDIITVRDPLMAGRIEDEARESASQPRQRKWDYPFASLIHAEEGEPPGVRRPPIFPTADLTLKLFLGLETPCALCMVDDIDRKRAMVATGVRITPVRGKHSDRRRT